MTPPASTEGTSLSEGETASSMDLPLREAVGGSDAVRPGRSPSRDRVKTQEAAGPSAPEAVVLSVRVALGRDEDELDELATRLADQLGALIGVAIRRGGEPTHVGPGGLDVVFLDDDHASAAGRAVIAARESIALTEGMSGDAPGRLPAASCGLEAGRIALATAQGHRVGAGAPFEVARRLATEPGQLVAGPLVAARLARTAILVPVNGPEGAMRVLGPRAGLERLFTTSVGRMPLPFTGRDAELKDVADAARECLRSATPAHVAITGGAGVGTSRFLAEFAARLGRDVPNLAVLGAVVPPTDGGDLDALVHMLAADARVRPEDGPETVERRFERWLSRLVISDADASSASTHALAAMTLHGAFRVSARERNDALGLALSGLARRSPVLLAFDGATTLAGLRPVLAAFASSALPIVFASAGRRQLVSEPDSAPLRRHLELELTPLDAKRAESLVRSALAAAEDVPRWLVREVTRLSDGLPLVVDLALTALEADGVIDTRSRPWRISAAPVELGTPSSLDWLSLATLRRLSLREQRAIDAATVLGTGITPEAMAAMGIADAATRLDGLVDVGVFTRGSDQTWLPARPALMAAAFRALSPRRARRLHRAAAEWLVQSSRGERALSQIARHYALAGDDAAALPYAERAAARAAETPRLTDAVERCRIAATLAERAHQRDPTAASLERAADADVRLAGQLLRAGQLDPASALAKARMDEAASPRIRSAAAVVLGWADEHRGRLDDASAAFGVGRLQGADRATRTVALQGLAAVAVKRGEHDDALAYLDEARQSTPDGDGAELARLRSTTSRLEGHAHLRAGRFDAAEAAYVASRVHAVAGGAAEEEVDALNGRAALHYFAGDLERAEAAFREALHAAERWDLVHVEGYILTNLGEVTLKRGDGDGATKTLRVALARHEALGNDEGVAESQRLLAEAALAAGDLATAREWATAARASAERVGAAQLVAEAVRVTRMLEGG